MRILIVSILLIPGIALGAPRTFQELAALAIKLLNSGIGILLILGLVVYFFGIATNINKLSFGETERLRAHFVWGIIAIFVMVSVWGILALLRNTLFGGGVHSIGGGARQVLCTGLTDCRIGE